MRKSIIFAFICLTLNGFVSANDELELQNQSNEATALKNNDGKPVALVQNRDSLIGGTLVVFSLEGSPMSFALIDEDFEGIMPLRSVKTSEIIGHIGGGSVHDVNGLKSCSFSDVVLLDQSGIVLEAELELRAVPAVAGLPGLGLIKQKTSPIPCLELLQSLSS